MFHRFSTWWRALGVVLLSLATVTWPSAARAQTTASFSVIGQDAVVNLPSSGVTSVHLALGVPHGTVESIVVSVYSPVVYRSEVTSLVAGNGPTSPPLTTTGVSAPTCFSGTTFTLNISLFDAVGTAASHQCGSAPLHLRLPCVATSCDGVYPMAVAVTVDGTRSVEWSMFAVHVANVLHPLRVVYVPVLDPASWSSSSTAQANLAVIARYASVPLTFAVDYRPLSQALLSTAGREWRSAVANALASPAHRAVAAPPNSVDLAGLYANGFAGEVSRQLTITSQFLNATAGRTTDGPVFLSDPTSLTALTALAHAGVTQVVLPDDSLSVTPSTTLDWGAPFHPNGLASVTALATDSGVQQLAADAAIEPGRRAAMTLATLAFLHFEEPNAPSVRTVVVPINVGQVSTTFLDDLLALSQSNPFVALSPLASSFSASLVGTNASPVTRTLSTGVLSTWSSANAATLAPLITRVNSFLQAIAAAPTQSIAIQTYLALAEQIGTAQNRETALQLVNSYLTTQLSHFRIDDSTITLTGANTTLPLTLFSSAHYPVTVVLHLISDRLTYPGGHGANIAVTLSTPTTPLRIPVINKLGGSLTLQLKLTTPNGEVVLAQAPVQVRVASTSVVGYLLSAGSLLVLAWWWLRTYRRKSRGRHAR